MPRNFDFNFECFILPSPRHIPTCGVVGVGVWYGVGGLNVKMMFTSMCFFIIKIRWLHDLCLFLKIRISSPGKTSHVKTSLKVSHRWTITSVEDHFQCNRPHVYATKSRCWWVNCGSVNGLALPCKSRRFLIIYMISVIILEEQCRD